MAANEKTASPKPVKASTHPVDDGKPIKITLLHGRGRHLGWVLFGCIAGVLLIGRFGSLGQGVGAILLAIAAQQGYRLAQTILRAPGTFRVSGDAIELPTGLCSGTQLTLTRDEVGHTYFLRRSVPWTQAGPILVIEAKGTAYSFPRDWFASDSEQRRVEMALNRHLRRKAA